MMKNINENFFQNIFESMPDGMWITDSQHRIIYANRAMAGIAGVGVDQIVGQSVLDGVAAEFGKNCTLRFSAAA